MTSVVALGRQMALAWSFSASASRFCGVVQTVFALLLCGVFHVSFHQLPPSFLKTDMAVILTGSGAAV